MQQKTEYVNTNVILLILFVHIVLYFLLIASSLAFGVGRGWSEKMA